MLAYMVLSLYLQTCARMYKNSEIFVNIGKSSIKVDFFIVFFYLALLMLRFVFQINSTNMDLILHFTLCMSLLCYIIAKPTSKCVEENPQKCAEDFIKQVKKDEEYAKREHNRDVTQTTTKSPTSTKYKVAQGLACDAKCQKRKLIAVLLCRRRRTCKDAKKMMKKKLLFLSLSLSSLRTRTS